ncbi:hypothetical protein NEFER01_2204 [Nematocida sp. LUAm1]|nr:hypothetical protein NEFER02_2136 [Nematocida sp. LUAm2]KAI5179368.1 hypothetical protein NEFER01_2204 [Nematocida sp. LUAm1]
MKITILSACIGALKLVRAMEFIGIGVDDSFLNTTISRGDRHVITDKNSESIVNTNGIYVGTENTNNKHFSIFSPYSLHMEEDKNIPLKYPFLSSSVKDKRRIFSFSYMRTEVPEAYIYSKYLKKKIEEKKKKGETIRSINITARGYSSREQRKRIGESTVQAASVSSVHVVSDAVAIAAEYVVPGKEDKLMDIYVFRGSKVVASFIKYTASDKKIKALTHIPYDIYNEYDIYRMIEEFLAQEITQIVEQHIPKTVKIHFYGGTTQIATTAIGKRASTPHTTPQATITPQAPVTPQPTESVTEHATIAESVTESAVEHNTERVAERDAVEHNEKHIVSDMFYNILPQVNSVILMINNRYEDPSVNIIFEQIVLSGEEEHFTIVPFAAQSHHTINITELRNKIFSYLTEKKEQIDEIVNSYNEEKKKYSEEPSELLIYNDIFLPDIFTLLLTGTKLIRESSKPIGKVNLSKGCVYLAKEKMKVEDEQSTQIYKSHDLYKLNGKLRSIAAVEGILKEEEEIVSNITLLVHGETSEHLIKSLSTLEEQERKELVDKLRSVLGTAVTEKNRRSKEMIEAIDQYQEAIAIAEKRKHLVASIDGIVSSIKNLLSECALYHKEVKEHLPEEAESFSEYLKKVTEDLHKMQEETKDKEKISAKLHGDLSTLEIKLTTRHRMLQKLLKEHLDREKKAAEQQATTEAPNEQATEVPATEQAPIAESVTEQAPIAESVMENVMESVTEEPIVESAGEHAPLVHPVDKEEKEESGTNIVDQKQHVPAIRTDL